MYNQYQATQSILRLINQLSYKSLLSDMLHTQKNIRKKNILLAIKENRVLHQTTLPFIYKKYTLCALLLIVIFLLLGPSFMIQQGVI